MIQGLHVLLFSQDAEADRAFLRDVLDWPFVEDSASEPGWLIFRAPPTEVGVHPADTAHSAAVHLMCDDIEATVRDLAARSVPTTPIVDEGYGLAVQLTLPSGMSIGLYEPRHASPLNFVSGT
ncbi:MAG: extradiol dioxygenase [Pseudonocardia sp.]|nr:extradiol dioxygenase [Pseudonocardia sp.]